MHPETMLPDANAAEAVFTSAERDFAVVADSGCQELFIELAGRPVRLRIADEALYRQVTPAFGHLVIAPCERVALTICMWNGAATRLEVPWSARHYGERGEIEGFNDARFATAFLPLTQVLTMLDRERGVALYRLRHKRDLSWWESAAPLRELLQYWCAGEELLMAHAGAVGTASGGVLLAGNPGAGKSTSALACLGSALRVAGDDRCLVQVTPSPHVYSLHCTAKLERGNIDRLDHLRRDIVNLDRLHEEKALLMLDQRHRDALIRSFPLRAILVPNVTGRPTTSVEAISAGQALFALAPSSLLPLVGGRPPSFSLAVQLVRQLPCYRLDLGTRLSTIATTIGELLTQLGHPPQEAT